MLSEKLKENTKLNHQALERKLIARMRTLKSKEDYAKFIALFYSYFGGLELSINKYLDLSQLPDYGRRRKTSALADDLSLLGEKLPVLYAKSALPKINNHCQAFGALYVIEGSTLGGRVICKMLSEQMDMTGFSEMLFFNGYGDQTASMWQIFKQSMDQPVYKLKHEIVIESANHTFIKFGNCF